MASTKLAFTGRVAVITGAGGGLGREYALEFARRGASVVVNDLGGNFKGQGKSANLADKVVKEIQDEGGQAVANYDSVEEGEKIIDTAIQNYGKVDIVINNAGILRDRSFLNMKDEDWDKVFQVHVKGAFKVTKAAWPHMRKQRYGRIIMTTSPAGLYGNFGQSNYSAAKMALLGLCNTLSIEGKGRNIFVNTIAPLAMTRMTLDVFPEGTDLQPQHICPFVIYLCHEDCQETGSLVEAAGGFACKTRLQRSQGMQLRQFVADNPTVESVAENWSRLSDFTVSTPVDDNQAGAAHIMEQIRDIPASPLPANATALERMQAHRIPDLHFAYTSGDVIRYALSIGAGLPDDLPFIYEGHSDFCVIPTFASVMGQDSVFKDIVGVPGFDQIDLSRAVHGEQYIELMKPIPSSGEFTTRTRVVDCLDKRKFTQVIIESEVMDSNNDVVCKNQFVVLFLGSGGIGRRGKSDVQVSALPPPRRAPDAVCEEKTGTNQAAYYRLNGDPNPLHIDQDIASMVGFKEPILHGLCTYGYGLRHILKTYVKHDVSLFKSIKGQFSKPVIPGQTLVTEMWCEGSRVHFQVKVKENGNVVIKGGYVDFHKDVTPVAASPSTSASPPPPAQPNSTGASNLKSDQFFTELKSVLSSAPDLAKSMNAAYLFQITVDKKIEAEYLLDFKQSPPVVSNQGGKGDVTIKVSDDDFVKLADGKLNPMQAFMQGKIKVSGQIALAQKLDTVFKTAKSKVAAGDSIKVKPVSMTTTSSTPTSLKSEALFNDLKAALSSDPGLVKTVKGTFCFQITEKGKSVGSYHLDFNSTPPEITSNEKTKADVTIKVSDDNLILLADGKLNPMQAFMQGKIKVSGQIALAQKLDTVFKAGKKKMEATAKAAPTAATAPTTTLGGDSTLKAHALFSTVKSKIAEMKDTTSAFSTIKGAFLFKITRAQKLAGEFLLNFNQSPPVIGLGPGPADVTLTIEDDDLELLATGKLNPMHAFMNQKLKAKGKVMLAQKLNKVFDMYKPSKL